MLGAGTVINPIIKIVTTVAILAAIGIFVVRPILDATEDLSHQVNESIRDSAQQSQHASEQGRLQAAVRTIEAYVSSLQSSWPEAARELSSCARAAGASLDRVDRCQKLGETLVYSVQADRSFALSYADTLAAQGDDAAAGRVRRCVDRAGFKPGPMHDCRDLANDLVFG